MTILKMTNTDNIARERFLLQEEFLGTDKEVNRMEPLVSVSVVTYRHAGYIRECLDGILMQRTDFPFEVIVGEDGSTDGTREICEEYARRHPDRIRLFNRDRTLSQYVDEDGRTVRFNGLWNRMSVCGKYVAFCEGDDYWTDPLKLQKQVDWLESHPECGLVHGMAREYIQSEGTFSGRTKGRNADGFDVLLKGNRIATLTVCYRTEFIRMYSEQIGTHSEWLMGDYPMWLYIAANSQVHFIAELMAVYRVLVESASHSTDLARNNAFEMSICDVREFFARKYGRSDILAGLKKQRLRKVLKNSLRYRRPMSLAECREISPTVLSDIKLLGLFVALKLKTIGK